MGNKEKVTMLVSPRPDVFKHEDIRSFLLEWLNYLKVEKNLSLRHLTRQAKISAPYLSMILKGTRMFSLESLQKFLVHLHLTQQERRFLELLFTIGVSESAEIRLEALSEIARLSNYQKSNHREHEIYKYLTKWYYVAIREMVLLSDFKFDAEWIQKRLRTKISIAEIKEALLFLSEKKLIAKDENGNFSLPEIDMQCKEGVFKISLAEFHRQVFLLANQSIHEVERDSRYILGRTVAISKKEFKEAKEIFDEALAKIEQLGMTKETTEKEVYHFEFVAFPFTKMESEKS